MKLITCGKVKDVYEIDDSKLEFLFSDRISVFDKIIPSKIPRKGEVLCQCSRFWFEKLEDGGIATHFIESAAPDRMRVKRFRVIKDYSKLNNRTVNYQVPLEFITRWFNAGSLYRKMSDGVIAPEDAGFEPGHKPIYGEPLPKPYTEQTTKFEQTDRLLDRDEALKISALREDELDSIMNLCLKIDRIIEKEVNKRDLMHVDGKKEFAMDENRNIVLIDTFGTPDEDRFWDVKEYEKGNIVEMSKEFVRKFYENDVLYSCPLCSGSFSYKALLDSARAKDMPEPEIPPLPDEMVRKTADIYLNSYRRITGKEL